VSEWGLCYFSSLKIILQALLRFSLTPDKDVLIGNRIVEEICGYTIRRGKREAYEDAK
jgi:hypothetical protein